MSFDWPGSWPLPALCGLGRKRKELVHPFPVGIRVRVGQVVLFFPSSPPTSDGLQPGLFTDSASPIYTATAMASGVTVSDAVVRTFNDMKVRKCATPEEMKKRKKAVIFCLSDDKKSIILEEGKEILVGECDEIEDVYKHFINMLPKEDCRYALYDATYETNETKKEDLVFIMWAPECASLKNKMIYASSKDACKKKFPGIKHEYQANHYEDICDRSSLANKLGGATVKTLEGKPV